MVAASSAIDAVLVILRRYCDDATIDSMMHDLAGVPGDQSFRETVEELIRRSRKSRPR